MIERSNNAKAGEELRSALFSDCEKYRYLLSIMWDPDLPRIQFIGLNPSTADEMKDDRTITRIKSFAKAWGYGTVMMTNLFAFRATYPEDMFAYSEPIGETIVSAVPVDDGANRNDYVLMETRNQCETAIACWGNHGVHLYRAAKVKQFLKNLSCFRLTKTKQPEHPLYLKGDITPIPLPL